VSRFNANIIAEAEKRREMLYEVGRSREVAPEEVSSIDREGTKRREDFFSLNIITKQGRPIAVLNFYVLDIPAVITPTDILALTALDLARADAVKASIQESHFPHHLLPTVIDIDHPIPAIRLCVHTNLDVQDDSRTKLHSISRCAINSVRAYSYKEFGQHYRLNDCPLKHIVEQDHSMQRHMQAAENRGDANSLGTAFLDYVTYRAANALGKVMNQERVCYITRPYTAPSRSSRNKVRKPTFTGLGRNFYSFVTASNTMAMTRGEKMPFSEAQVLELQKQIDSVRGNAAAGDLATAVSPPQTAASPPARSNEVPLSPAPPSP
jgi:hypothetical protein